MAITYNAAQNAIIVTGYTEGVPCNFTDVYNADKAGTLSLHARTGVSAADGGTVAVDRAERPTDYVVLGGASNDLYITVANWTNMTTATIRVTGTDRDGAAQTDDVVVNANGNFSTALWFKTITHTQVTVFTKSDAGSFDYDLTQGQWGVVWKQGNVQYGLKCTLVIGNHSTSTWFADTKKQVAWIEPDLSNYFWIYCNITNQTNVEFGTLVDETLKITKEGVQFLFDDDTHAQSYVLCWPTTTVNLYSCIFDQSNLRADIEGDFNRIWNTISGCIFENVDGATFENYIGFEPPGTTTALSEITNSTLTNLVVLTTGRVLYSSAATSTAGGWTIRGLYARTTGALETFRMDGAINAQMYAIDADVNYWLFEWINSAGANLFRQYSFNLRVVDAAGVGIASVTVTMVDVESTEIFSVSTDGSGDIAEQIVTYGYYDADNGNTIQPAGTYSPHTITISKANYVTRKIKYTMDRAREDVEKLTDDDGTNLYDTTLYDATIY